MWNSLILDRKDYVATLTVNRPSQLNALNLELLKELEEAISQLSDDEQVHVVIITGAGTKAFVAGADIAAMQSMTPAEARSFASYGQKVFSYIENMPQPVIAMVQGFALGGGCELAMACDIRIASESARFGQPEVGLGITPGFGGSQRLPRLVGRGRASWLLYTGRMINAAEALSLGLVDQVVEPERLLDVVNTLALDIASHSVHAVRQIKRCIHYGLQAGLESGISYESQAFGLCFSSDDQKKFMNKFLSKKKK